MLTERVSSLSDKLNNQNEVWLVALLRQNYTGRQKGLSRSTEGSHNRHSIPENCQHLIVEFL